MRRFIALACAVSTTLALSACGSTGTNVNAVVLDLVNEPTNASTPAATNVSGASNSKATSNANAAAASNANLASVDVTLSASGFSPATVRVRVGQTVTWVNSAGAAARIASDPHPTHTDLPDLDSSMLEAGATYRYTFTQRGTWGYHNHLDPTTEGTIVVE